MVVLFKLAVQEQLESHVWLISGSLIILIVAVTLAVLILIDKLDTGFSGKTLWDLIEKLGVPVLVVVIGGGLALSAQRAGRRTEDEHERTTERAREATLREYLDRISDLILNHDLICTSGDSSVRAVAQARTLGALRGLNGPRKGILVRFLYGCQLIKTENPIISLNGADLKGADLSSGELTGCNLSGANLRDADFYDTDLAKADLSQSVVDEEQLRDARGLVGATMPDGVTMTEEK